MPELATVLIITGLPGTGKTTLGEQLAQDLEWPFINKDGIKERLFDTLGWSDREWSKKLGIASVDLLYLFAERQLAVGQSFVMESNFHPEFANGEFQALAQKYPFKAVQVECFAEGEILFERFKARALRPDRHPGHVEETQFDQFRAALSKSHAGLLDLEGPTFELDTTDFEKVNYETLLAAIKDVI